MANQKQLICLFIVILSFMCTSCSSKNERLLTGKWSLAGKMIGGAPSSFWFKWNGAVVAPWEDRHFAMISEGAYEFVDDTHIKIMIHEGHYKGNVYYFSHYDSLIS